MAISLTFPEGGALVTGGTGRLGEGMVRQLARADVPLVFTFLNSEAPARALEAELRADGHRVAAVRMDSEDQASVDAALDRVVTDFGRLHTVAVGSGLPVPFAPIADFAVETVARFVAGDAIGYFRLFRAAVRIMRGSGGGSIVACSTFAAARVLEYDGISPFSKGAVNALVRQLAFEEAPNGIRVNAIAIGWIDRTGIAEVRARLPAARPVRGQPATQLEMTGAVVDQVERFVRLGRPGTIEEGGNLAAFLASDQAGFLTGQIIAFDGGATL